MNKSNINKMEELRSLLHDEYLDEVADLFDKFIEWCEIRSYPIDSISFKMFIHESDKGNLSVICSPF